MAFRRALSHARAVFTAFEDNGQTRAWTDAMRIHETTGREITSESL
jgi:hypothetical protein